MADFQLSSGAMVTIDPEDLELLSEGTWRSWDLQGSTRCVRDVQAKGRQYRLHLHREVAMRMRPSLIRQADRMQVTPRNGDFLDVRRDNLEIAVSPRKRAGQPKRAGGARVRGYKADPKAPRPTADPPAWSRQGCAGAVGVGHGRDCALAAEGAD